MITIVMAYYNNPTMLKRHIEEWKEYPKGFRAIIVDDGSEEAALPILKENCPIPLQLYRITVDKPWNQNCARNLAMTHSRGWCLMTDMDHLLTIEEANKINLEDYQEQYAYKPLRRRANGDPYDKRHPNSFLLTHDLFWEVGGYNENTCGWYGTDSMFRKKLKNRTLETSLFALNLYEGVIEDAITRTYGRKDSHYHLANNKRLIKDIKQNNLPTTSLNFPWIRQL
jgi:hypothetical protein